MANQTHNDKVFNVATDQLLDELVSAADREAEHFERRIEELIERYQRNIYVAMSKMMGLNSAPPFVSQGWPNLSEGYREAKGGKNEFWDYSSRLKQELLSRNPRGDFGAPRVRTRASGTLNEGYTLDARGRARYSAGTATRDARGRRMGGRFAPAGSAFRAGSVSYEVTLDIVPRLPRQVDALMKNIAGGDERLFFSMASTEFGRTSMAIGDQDHGRSSPINHPARPLFRPFIEYYVNDFIPMQIRKEFRTR